MSTLSIQQYNGAIALKLGTAFDELDVNINAAGNGINVDVRGKASTLKLTGSLGDGTAVSVAVDGTLNMSAASFSGIELAVSGDIGASFSIPNGIDQLNLSGLQGCTELSSGTTDFPNSVLLLNFVLSRLVINAPNFQGQPANYGFAGGSLPQGDVDGFLELCAAYLANGGDVSQLQVDFSGGTNAAPSATGLANVVTLTAAGAFITHN